MFRLRTQHIEEIFNTRYVENFWKKNTEVLSFYLSVDLFISWNGVIYSNFEHIFKSQAI